MNFVEHNLCEHCWHKHSPQRPPVRVVNEPPPDVCCECGCPTYTGIYVRGVDEQFQDCKHSPTRFK